CRVPAPAALLPPPHAWPNPHHPDGQRHVLCARHQGPLPVAGLSSVGSAASGSALVRLLRLAGWGELGTGSEAAVGVAAWLLRGVATARAEGCGHRPAWSNVFQLSILGRMSAALTSVGVTGFVPVGLHLFGPVHVHTRKFALALTPEQDSASAMMVVIDTLLPLLLSCISYRLLVCCVISTPIVHLLGFYTLGVKHGSRSGSGLARLLLFPFSGGKRHAAFQLFGWGLWAASAIVSLPLWLSGPLSGLRQLRDALPNIPHTHVDVVSGAAAATSFVGQLFLVQAL
ncbi:diacylglycerol acyltransferase, partial [Haematococcus lacustris]